MRQPVSVSDDTVPALVTVRIDSASHQRPEAPISMNSGSEKLRDKVR
ncbi:hypothetical protein OG413_42740 [Streptomyces sp. NBC_01433]|nr:hypothetical protein [Streptomyces sp. NBC_01433]MCX4681918.1 hypothetical protein [Streptomyces sp. NBC_01433]